MPASTYATLGELKERLGIADTSEDDELTSRLTAAARQVDKDCGQRPGGFEADAAPSTRTYTPSHPELLIVDDISTADGLVVEQGYATSWLTVPATFYELRPANNIADGKAANRIARVLGCWPVGDPYRVRVTATFGWPALPDEIHEATLLRASRLFRRKGSPEGVAGFSDQGVVRVGRVDPDYESLISGFIRDEK